MFKTIARLIFGGEEEQQATEDVKSRKEEAEDEEWLVVSHDEAVSAENNGLEKTDAQTSASPLHVDAVVNMETEVSAFDPEPQNQTGSPSGRAAAASVSQLKALAQAVPLSFVPKGRSWVERHHTARNAIQRQNRVRQGVQHNVFHLQQPGLRNLCH